MTSVRLCAISACLFVLTGALCAATITVTGRDSAAIARAIAASKSGDTVLLPAGTYTISATIAPQDGTRLLGAGQGKTLLRFAGDKPLTMIDLTGRMEGVEIAGLTLDALENPNAERAIMGYNSRNLRIHHVTIRNTAPKNGNPAIHFSGDNPTFAHGVSDSTIADCTFENIGVASGWGCGVRFSWGSSRNSVLRCTIRNTGRGGVLTDNRSNDLVIRGNTITGSGGEGLGIEVWNYCDRCVIEDNHLDHWLSIGGSDWCAARRNVISDKTGAIKAIGIEVIGSYCIVTDNLVDDGQAIGISVSNINAKDCVYYADNIVRRCTQWGAQFQGETTGTSRNYLYRCAFNETTAGRGNPPYPGADGNGFRINGDMTHSVLEECEARDNARDGLQLGGGNVDFLSFIKCRIVGNKGPACEGPGAYTALEWVDCTVQGNGSNALPPAKPFPTPPPSAEMLAPASATVGNPVALLCKSDAASEVGSVVLWDFGDGIPVTGRSVKHIYDRPGKYDVAMILWDKAGRGVRVGKTLNVTAR